MSGIPISSIQIDIETGWRGGQRQVELLCKGLSTRGHPVKLITRPGTPLGKKLRDSNIEVFETPVVGGVDPFAARRIGAFIRQAGPAVVGMHSSHAHTLGALCRSRFAPGPKYLVHRRVDFSPGTGFFDRWKYRRSVDGYVAISQAVRKALVDSGVEGSRIDLVPSGVVELTVPQDSRARIESELNISPDRIIILDVASLVDHKGHKYLIEAFSKVVEEFPEALLLLAGDGELRASLEAQATSLNLTPDHLRFLGRREDVGTLLGAADLFAMTSHLEGLCTSILDAQLAGVPVIGTNAGGIPELVFNEKTGLLAENKNPGDIASKIKALLQNPAEGTRLTEAARQHALNGFTADAMVEGTIRAYRRFLE
jgi:L-malate glycosyltransferase